MPTHVYPPNDPDNVTWQDRLLVHPMESTVGALSVLFGVLVALSLAIPPFDPSSSLEQLPTWVNLAVGLFLGVGGGLAMLGVYWWGDKVSLGWALERVGWSISGAGFATYGISVSWLYINSIFSWTFPLVLAAGCGVRFISVFRIERKVRRDLAAARERGASL